MRLPYLAAERDTLSIGKRLPSRIRFFSSRKIVYAYADGNPVSYRDPSGKLILIITGGIGAAASAVGNIIVQLHRTGDISCINWRNVGVSAVTGFAVGFAAPLVATAGLAGAIGLGAVGNLANYSATQLVNFDSFNPQDAVTSLETGAVAGLAGGAFVSGNAFSTTSAWLLPGLASTLNVENSLALNVTITNLFRNLGSGVISSSNP